MVASTVAQRADANPPAIKWIRGTAWTCTQAQRSRLSVPDSVADRLLRTDPRSDHRLAGPVLHQILPARAARLAGLENYHYAFFEDDQLRDAVGVTFSYVLWSVPGRLVLALALAMLLDRGIRGVAFFRAVFYLPSLLGASVAIAVLWRQIFGDRGSGQPLSWPFSALPGRPGSPIRAMRCGRWWSWRSGSSARR